MQNYPEGTVPRALSSLRRPVLLMALVLLAACSSTPSTRSAADQPGRAAASTQPSAAAQQRLNAALALLQEGRRDEAREALLALTRDYPQYSGPFTDLGILYARNRQRDDAIAAFRKAVSVNPRNAVAWNWLGTLYREAGQFSAADQAYRSAIAARPQDPAAHLNLAILYDVSLHRPDIALPAYREYQRLAGSEARAIVSVWIKELELRGVDRGIAMADKAAVQP